MATYTVQKLPDESIVIITTHEGYDPSQHVTEAAKAVNRVLDKVSGPVVFIQDLTSVKTDMDDIMVAADTTGRGDAAPFHHANIGEIITVTQDPILRRVFEGMQTDTYGNIKMVILDTLDEALAYARQR
ncbi:MAG: hypothetical protein JXQ72_09805 [Anaerolineae bacterium]|nr:hypothetical protein [Anaerolineae bacterium]